MRPVLIGFAVLLGPAFIFAACGQDPSSAATGSSSGTGGVPNCDGIVIVNHEDAGNSCDVCLHKECCAEVAACPDKYCKDCVNFLSPGCNKNTQVNALNDCLVLHCDSTCNPKLPPLTTSSGAGGGTSSSASGG